MIDKPRLEAKCSTWNITLTRTPPSPPVYFVIIPNPCHLHRIMLTPDSRTAQKYFRKNPDCKHPKTASNDNSEPNVEEQGL